MNYDHLHYEVLPEIASNFRGKLYTVLTETELSVAEELKRQGYGDWVEVIIEGEMNWRFEDVED